MGRLFVRAHRCICTRRACPLYGRREPQVRIRLRWTADSIEPLKDMHHFYAFLFFLCAGRPRGRCA